MKFSNPTKQHLEAYLLEKYLNEKHAEETSSDLAVLRYKSKLLQITPKLFFQFLIENNVPLICTLCKKGALSVTETYVMQTEMNLPPPTQTEIKESEQLLPTFRRSYVSYCTDEEKVDLWSLRSSTYHVYCNECGHLKTFMTRPVIKWYEKLSNGMKKNDQ